MIAAHAIISGFIDEPMYMHMGICRGVYASLMRCWFHGDLDVSGASRVSLLVTHMGGSQLCLVSGNPLARTHGAQMGRTEHSDDGTRRAQ